MNKLKQLKVQFLGSFSSSSNPTVSPHDNEDQSETMPLTEGMSMSMSLAIDRLCRTISSTTSILLDKFTKEDDEEEEVYYDEEETSRPKVSLMMLLEEERRNDEHVYTSDHHSDHNISGFEESCCICMDKKKGAAFIPCGHTFCRACARELWLGRGSCALCNRGIQDILTLY